MKKISKRQEQVLNFIINEVKSKGYPPSVREIGEAVGLTSSSTVHGHLSRLESKGLIRRDPTKPRAIEILDERFSHPIHQATEDMMQSVVNVPVIGKVTAGTPITAIENVENYFPLPDNMLYDSNSLYMLEISGDSMIEAGILDGDLVLVKKQSDAKNGDIIIAMTDEDEATCKRFFKENDHIRLQPENSSLEPIIVQSVSILGKVVGLYRRDIH